MRRPETEWTLIAPLFQKRRPYKPDPGPLLLLSSAILLPFLVMGASSLFRVIGNGAWMQWLPVFWGLAGFVAVVGGASGLLWGYRLLLIYVMPRWWKQFFTFAAPVAFLMPALIVSVLFRALNP